jgi:hypothetical protein
VVLVSAARPGRTAAPRETAMKDLMSVLDTGSTIGRPEHDAVDAGNQPE